MDWTAPQKPTELTEGRLIDAILEGHFSINSFLPAERELARQMGVTRPTLREALQRLERDGWLEIHQGRPTRVRDYWQEGSLGVLGDIASHSDHLPADFVPNLLFVRQLMAPAYTRLAVERAPEKVIKLLEAHTLLPEQAEEFAAFDWKLHYQLTIASGNPIFTMILNGFQELYLPMACLYFQTAAARASSRHFYAGLYTVSLNGDAQAAELLTQRVMGESLDLWRLVK